MLAANPSPMTLEGTRTYLVGRERPVVIDPGPARESHHAALLEALGGARPVAILLTHAHPDHAPGAVRLAHETGAPVLMAPGALAPSIAPGEVARWIGEGERLETDAGVLRAIATPGHTPEHLAFHWTEGGAPAGGALFVGDLLMGMGDTALVASPEGDLAEYLRSLERVGDVGASVLYPAHGAPLTDPAQALARYRAHREERIAQVRAALGPRPRSAAELVDEVYGPALHPALREAAEGSLAAVLAYLTARGEAERLDWDRYTLTR